MPEDTFLRAIVTQAWQIAVLTIIVAMLVRFFAAKKPQVAHWLWLIVIVKCVTPPLWGHSFGLFSQIQSVVANGDVQAIEAGAPAAEADMTADFSSGSFAHDLDVYPVETEDVAFSFEPETLADEIETIADNDRAGLLDVWAFTTWLLIAGMIVSMLWLSWKFACCLRRIYAHRVTEFDDEIEAVVATLAKELRLRRVPRVIISDVRFGPAVLGIFRHLIVLPKCLIADEGCRDLKTLRPILAHELLHIRRGDLWTGTLQALVQCLWWFHPAVWIVNRLLSGETERSCDEQVVSELGCSPLEYARSLLAVIESKHSLKPVPVFPGMKPVEITSQRMERIMSLKQGSRTRMSWWSVSSLLLFAAVMLPGAVIGQQSEKSEVLVAGTTSSTAPAEWKPKSDSFSNSDTTFSMERAEAYQVEDLLGQLRGEHKLSSRDAKRLLLAHLKQASNPIPDTEDMIRPTQLPAINSLSAEWRKGSLVVTQNAEVHERIRQRLAQFRQYGFAMIRIRVTVISGPADDIHQLIADCPTIPSRSIRSQPGPQASPLTLEMLHSTLSVTDAEKLGRAKHCFQLKTVASKTLDSLKEKAQCSPQIQIDKMVDGGVWNGVPRKFQDCVVRPFIEGYDNGQPQIRQISDGLAINLKPELLADGTRITCGVNMSTIDLEQSVTLSQIVRGKRMAFKLPSVRTCRANAQVTISPNQAFVFGGLSTENTASPDQSLMVVIQAEPIESAVQEKSNDEPIVGIDCPDEVTDASQESTPPTADRLMFGDGIDSDAGVTGKFTSESVPETFSVIGCVQAPGRFEKRDELRLVDALEMAGGLNESAGDLVVVRRKDRSGVVAKLPDLSLKAATNDAAANIEIHHDDVIAVESFDYARSREKLAKKVTLRFANATVKGALRLIATEYDVDFAIEPGSTSAKDKVSIAVGEVPLEEALELICEQCNLTFVDEHEVIKITSAQPKPASVVESETRYDLRVYPVANLVLPVPGAVPTTKRQPLAINHTPTEKFLYELQSDMVDRNFTSLIELIRTTIEPDSWDGVSGSTGVGRLAANTNTLSIVIRQKPEIHDEIVELLGELRRSQGQTVVTSLELLIFHTSQQIEWLEKNVKFHQHMNNHPWALVPSNRTNLLAKAKENSNAFAYGPFTSFAGKLVSLTVSGREKYDLSVHLKGTPLGGGDLIEMEYGAKLSAYAGKTRPVGTQVMNNKQTLLFDLSVKSANPKFRAVAVITPSIVHEAKLEIE